MASIGAVRIGKKSLRRSEGMGSSEHVVGFEVATTEARASAEISWNWESVLVGQDTEH